ncbi:SPOR domain-containing protein [Shewanella surugensis]|uniref:SPOR domain-containing protein n=1 Tax=Shewanella surugensis TaxID=212020 RepID=A0ABT0LHC2_9GAMM|nr:SPOR domain-containing protein [Shewanella surugensis]MCL1127112.1 SPOR domain-containing protein [Shewanella surugensis]
MPNHFQNRLVGVIVIVALGVLFLPDLLNGKKQRQEETFTEIPLKPALKETRLPEKAYDVVNTDVDKKIDKAVTAAASVDEKDRPTKSQESPPKASLSSSAWTLRLGSFNNAKNVTALVERLRKQGFNAYTLPSKPIDGQLTKVFVGPDVSKDKLVVQQSDIEKLTQLKGRIEAYNPVES